ncbi:hypothetical protein BaRGS_00027893, partial [Batillaria attramentaria]
TVKTEQGQESHKGSQQHPGDDSGSVVVDRDPTNLNGDDGHRPVLGGVRGLSSPSGHEVGDRRKDDGNRVVSVEGDDVDDADSTDIEEGLPVSDSALHGRDQTSLCWLSKPLSQSDFEIADFENNSPVLRTVGRPVSE